MRKTFQFKSIKTQITVTVVTLITVVCIGLAVIGSAIAAAGIRANMIDSMQEVVVQGANVVSGRVSEHFSHLHTLACFDMFQNANANKAEIMALLKKVIAENGLIFTIGR